MTAGPAVAVAVAVATAMMAPTTASQYPSQVAAAWSGRHLILSPNKMGGDVSERASTGVLFGVIAIAAAMVLLALLLAVPSLNVSFEIPIQHIYIVSAVALLAFPVATLLAVSAAQLQHYKLLLLGVGFMCMAVLFAIHGLATPGVIIPASQEYGPAAGSHSVVGVAGFLSLLVPAIFFALVYLPLLAVYERRLPFWPAGALVVVVVSAVSVFAVFAFAQSDAVAEIPVTAAPVIYGLAALAFPLLASAELAQLVSAPWTLAWWEYHVLMLVAVGLAFVALLRERRRGRAYRTVLESSLDLQVRAEFEMEHVAEITALAAAIEAKDHDTRGHTIRVAELSVAIARELGMPAPKLRVHGARRAAARYRQASYP
ncbi:MAG: hypothetical protein ABR598_06660 [Candidatus Dormibacteria bacterium]